MGHRFEKTIALQFCAVTGLLIFVGIAAYFSLTVAAENVRKVERAHGTAEVMDHLLSLVQDAEIGQRSYVLTGRVEDRQFFDNATLGLKQSLDTLAVMMRDDPEGSTQLKALREAIGAKVAYLRGTVESRGAAGLDATLPAVKSDKGKRLMLEVRGQIDALRREQGTVLDQLKERSARDARSALIVSAAGVSLTLAMLGFAFRLIVGELGARRRAEADLSRLAAIVASSDDAVVGMTLDGTVTSWNAAAERLLGHLAREAMGRHIDRFLPIDGQDRAVGLLERIGRGEVIDQLESVGLRKDGSSVDVELRISPIRDEAGMAVGASAIARDVTARKRAETLLRERTDALEAARARLAASAEFAAALNQPGVLETYRATLGCLARVARAPLAVLYDVVEGESPRARCAIGPDLLPLDSSTLQGEGLPASIARGGEPMELFGPFEDPALITRFGLGEVPLTSILGWPVSFRGRTLGVLVTAHVNPPDAERRLFVVAALEQLAVRMEGFQVEQQRLKLLADLRGQSRALETARLESERANKAKSEFLAAMSHELRTPMNSIMGFTARLIRTIGPTMKERDLDALKTVDRNAKHLLVLINDILDLSKIEAGKMEVHAEPLDLAALAREAAGQSAPLFDGKAVELVVDLPELPVVVNADPKLIKQVVLNLLSNASKFTERGSVTISASLFEDGEAGEAARISVRDTGVGIKVDDLAKLFQRFSQLDSGPGRKVGGTGLGLALSERMARLHGGRIDVSSEIGRGSEFALILPVERNPSRRTSQGAPPPVPAALRVVSESVVREAAAADPGRGVTILCVDDEPDALKYLKLTFEDAGYRVFTAAGHDEAVAGARAHRPDLICLDLSMPGKDGFEVVRSLRADPTLAGVPVLVVSATSEETRALRAGARLYLAKPAEAGALVEAVQELLVDVGTNAGDILVVDDDRIDRRLVSAALTKRGLRIRTADDGAEALRLVAESPPAAIVLDLMMPVMDGFTFLKHLGQDPVWRQIPVVVMTGRALEPSDVGTLTHACAAVLTKGKGDTGRLVDAVLQAVRPREGTHASAGEAMTV